MAHQLTGRSDLALSVAIVPETSCRAQAKCLICSEGARDSSRRFVSCIVTESISVLDSFADRLRRDALTYGQYIIELLIRSITGHITTSGGSRADRYCSALTLRCRGNPAGAPLLLCSSL